MTYEEARRSMCESVRFRWMWTPTSARWRLGEAARPTGMKLPRIAVGASSDGFMWRCKIEERCDLGKTC